MELNHTILEAVMAGIGLLGVVVAAAYAVQAMFDWSKRKEDQAADDRAALIVSAHQNFARQQDKALAAGVPVPVPEQCEWCPDPKCPGCTPF